MGNILQILALADYFGVQGLYGLCGDVIKHRLGVANCVQIFEKMFPLLKSRVFDEALQLFVKNVEKLIAKEEHYDWCWTTWRWLLVQEVLEKKVVMLFKAMKQ